MTLKELKESIAVSPNKEWLQNYELVINYPHINYKTTLKGVVNIYEFIIDQAEGYSSITNFPEELDKIRVRFINAKGNLLRLISQESVSKYSWDDNLKDISGNNTGQPIFLYGSPETDFLLKAHREKPDLFPGAYDYLKGDTSRVTTKTYLQGYLLAYEFTSKDFSLIAERKEAEKKSILTTRTNFQAKLGEAE